MKKYCLAALLASAFATSHAAVVTFDDLSLPAGGYAPVVNGYANLNWDNFDAILGSTYPGYGYDTGVVSKSNAAFNLNGGPATISSTSGAGFDLLGGYFTAAYTSANVTATALFENGTTSSVTFEVNSTAPIHQVLGWTHLASVTFTSFDPSSAPTPFVVDDLAAVAAVPEPACGALMLAGLGMVGLVRRRRREAATAI